MAWLKNVLVDLGVTVLIGLAVLLDQRWAWWVVAVYTPLMVVLKLAAAVSGGVQGIAAQRRGWAEPPEVFYHALYALNVALLAVGREWWLLAGWLVIWGLSAWAARR